MDKAPRCRKTDRQKEDEQIAKLEAIHDGVDQVSPAYVYYTGFRYIAYKWIHRFEENGAPLKRKKQHVWGVQSYLLRRYVDVWGM